MLHWRPPLPGKSIKPGDVRHMFCGRPANSIPGWPSGTMMGVVRILPFMVDAILIQKAEDDTQVVSGCLNRCVIPVPTLVKTVYGW